jgi:ribosomal protein L40E
MARIYTHLVDTDRVILEMNGLVKKEKDQNGQFTFVICPRCDTRNPHGAKICSKCYLGLDEKSVMTYDQEKEQATQVGFQTIDVLKDPSFRMEIKSILGEELAKLQQGQQNNIPTGKV